jgi:hypothetical protein
MRPTWTGLEDVPERDRFDDGEAFARENERLLRKYLGNALYDWLDREDPKEPYWYKSKGGAL